jgi:hypothetical protein
MRNNMLELKDFQPFEYENLVRRGSTYDGGYLLPSDITTKLLISLGMGDDWKFELDLINHKQIDRFIVFDHSVDLFKLLKKVINKRRNFKAFVFRVVVLTRYFKDFVVLKKLHVKKKITKYGSIKNSRETNLFEIFREFVVDPKSTVILKIDIEGSEFDIIEQIVELSSQIKVLIIEMHEILKQKDRVKQSLELLKSRYLLIHTHVNNYGGIDESSIPDVCEFTFINHNLHREYRKVSRLPRASLDSPSSPGRPDLSIIFT